MPQFRISIDRHNDQRSIPNHFGGGGNHFYPPALNPEQHTNNRYNFRDEDTQPQHHQQAVHTPATPRNICNPTTDKNASSFHHHLLQQPRTNNGMKQPQSRSFFPDSGPRSSCYMQNKKVQDIDWQLAEAVQQVVSLSLDAGPVHHHNSTSHSHNSKAEGSAFSRYESPNPMPPHRTA